MLYIIENGYINIIRFPYYLFSFTPFLHNKTVVAMRPFFCFNYTIISVSFLYVTNAV